MKEKLIEISEVVRKLNLEIFDSLNEVVDYRYDPPYTIITDCVHKIVIKFFGHEVWNYNLDEIDERKIIGKDDEGYYILEDFENFLRDLLKNRAKAMNLCTI